MVVQAVEGAVDVDPAGVVVVAKGERPVVGRQDAQAIDVAEARHHAAVDLVEGEPVLDQALVLAEAEVGVAHPDVDDLLVVPAAVLVREGQRELVVRERDQRLDAVLLALQEDVAVVLHASLVGRRLFARGEDAAHLDGQAEALEAHLRKEGDVLLVVVVEVDALVAGIVRVGTHTGRRHHARLVDGAAHDDVGHREALAVGVVAALKLVGSGGAAPQEPFGKCHGRTPFCGSWPRCLPCAACLAPGTLRTLPCKRGSQASNPRAPFQTGRSCKRTGKRQTTWQPRACRW